MAELGKERVEKSESCLDWHFEVGKRNKKGRKGREFKEKREEGEGFFGVLSICGLYLIFLFLESCLAYSYCVGKVRRNHLNPCNGSLSNSLHEYIVSPLSYSCFKRASHDDNVFLWLYGGTYPFM